MAVLLCVAYVILGALALLAAFLVLKIILSAIDHFLIVLPEYLWYGFSWVLILGAIVGVIIFIVNLFA